MHLSPKTRSFFPLPSLGFLHTNRLAAILQVLRKTFWRLQECCKCFEKLFGVCRNAASASKNFLAFAGTLQVPRKTFWRLQHRCKSHEKLSGVCNTVASASKNFLVFAGAPQVSRKTFWCLRESRKCLEKLSGVCNTVASVTKNFLAFATLLQAFPETFWPSRGFRKESLPVLCLHRTHVISVKACRAGTFLLLLRGQKTDGLTDKHKKENGKDFSGIRHGKRRLRSAYL